MSNNPKVRDLSTWTDPRYVYAYTLTSSHGGCLPHTRRVSDRPKVISSFFLGLPPGWEAVEVADDAKTSNSSATPTTTETTKSPSAGGAQKTKIVFLNHVTREAYNTPPAFLQEAMQAGATSVLTLNLREKSVETTATSEAMEATTTQSTETTAVSQEPLFYTTEQTDDGQYRAFVTIPVSPHARGALTSATTSVSSARAATPHAALQSLRVVLRHCLTVMSESALPPIDANAINAFMSATHPEHTEISRAADTVAQQPSSTTKGKTNHRDNTAAAKKEERENESPPRSSPNPKRRAVTRRAAARSAQSTATTGTTTAAGTTHQQRGVATRRMNTRAMASSASQEPSRTPLPPTPQQQLPPLPHSPSSDRKDNHNEDNEVSSTMIVTTESLGRQLQENNDDEKGFDENKSKHDDKHEQQEDKEEEKEEEVNRHENGDDAGHGHDNDNDNESNSDAVQSRRSGGRQRSESTSRGGGGGMRTRAMLTRSMKRTRSPT
eukprot:PhM_4_TR14352/c0_g2_i1/m.93994